MAHDPTFNEAALPRDQAREAPDAIRGFIHQFALVIDRLLIEPDAVVYVETLEDLLILSRDALTAQQVKSRGGRFSITQREPCEMLDRWAKRAESDPRISFLFASTQTAGNLHNKSDAFKRWVVGERNPETANEIRESVESYLTAARSSGTGPVAPTLTDLAHNPSAFHEFWLRIEWRLSTEELTPLIMDLTNRTSIALGIDEQTARQSVYSYLGRIALSASSRGELSERRWSLDRLKNEDRSALVVLLTRLITSLDRQEMHDVRASMSNILASLEKSRFDQQRAILDHILPFDLSGFLGTARFVGRKSLFSALESITARHRSAYILVEADAGLGKTSFAAEFCRRTSAHAFFTSVRQGRTRAAQCLRHLAASVIRHFNLDYIRLPDAAGDDPSFLSRALQEAIERTDAPLWIVVDALDEADPMPGANPLLLPERLPDGVFMLLTQRPGGHPLTIAPGMTLIRRTIASNEPEQLTDIESFLKRSFSEDEAIRTTLSRIKAQSDEQTVVNTILSASEGNFMYVSYLLADMASREPWDHHFDLHRLPKGLDGYYAQFWNRMQSNRDSIGWSDWSSLFRRVLTLLAVAREPVSVDWLADHSGRDKSEIEERVLSPWERFLRHVNTSSMRQWMVIHQSFADYLAQERKIDTTTAHREVAQYYRSIPARWAIHNAYARRHLTEHITRSGDCDAALQLIDDPNWRSSQLQTDPSGASYADDLIVARRASEELDLLAVAAGKVPSQLIHEASIAFEMAVLHSRAADIPPELVPELIKTGTWSITQGLQLARGNPDPEKAATTLRLLALHLHADHFMSALAIAREIRYPRERACALVAIASRMTDPARDEAINEALDAVRASAESDRAKPLGVMAPLLSHEQRLVAQALARECDGLDRAYALLALLPSANSQEREDLLSSLANLVEEVPQKWAKIRIIKNLAPELPAAERKIRLEQAFSLANSERPYNRIEQEISLLKYVAEDERSIHANRIRRELAATTVNSWLLEARLAVWHSPSEREEAMRALIAKLPNNLLGNFILLDVIRTWAEHGETEKSFELARASRLELYLAFESYPLPNTDTELLEKALLRIRLLPSGPNRATLLVRLIPKLRNRMRDDVITEALRDATQEEITIPAQLAAALAIRLPTDQRGEAVTAAASLAAEQGDATTLEALKAHMPLEAWEPLLATLVGGTQDHDNELHRARKLGDLVSTIGAAAAPMVIETARAISDPSARVDMMLSAASGLPPDERGPILDEVLATIPANPAWYRIARLCTLAVLLPTERRRDIVDEAARASSNLQSEEEDPAAYALVTGFLFTERPQEALAFARKVKDPSKRSQALLAVCNQVGGASVATIFAEALIAAEEIYYEPVLRFGGGVHRRIDQPVERTIAFATAARRLETEEERNASLQRIRILVNNMTNTDERAECLMALRRFVGESERSNLVLEAVSAALCSESDNDRARVLAVVARFFADLSRNDLYSSWRKSLHVMARAEVNAFLVALSALVPVVEIFGGGESVKALRDAIMARIHRPSFAGVRNNSNLQ